jgi:hypothetical protein|tara:strand:- start:584 stop:1006 length:423 start_codon:yes stop_codon:yes gene_type:complete
MGLLNEPGRRHSPEEMIWCIGEWSDDENRTIEENTVGYSENGRVSIGAIPDGEHPLIHWAYVYSVTKDVYSATKDGGIESSEAADKWTSKSKIRVKNGEVDIHSVKVAVAEILNQCGGRHVFIESLHFEKDGKVSAFLGS